MTKETCKRKCSIWGSLFLRVGVHEHHSGEQGSRKAGIGAVAENLLLDPQV